MPAHPQLDLMDPARLWQESVLSKVTGLIPWQVEEHLRKCGNEQVFRTCEGCGHWKAYAYQCCLKFCPLCNWRIQRRRAEMLRLWSLRVRQPKHVVLTCKNFELLTRKTIRQFQQSFAKLRRTKLWKPVAGGCISTEITNEGRGWHLHAHILADVAWLPADVLAVEWGRLVGQDFGIVKVKDVRGHAYLGEVTKYVVKGSQLAGWCAEHIAQLIHATRGIRMFACFGTLFRLQREVRQEMQQLRPPPEPCECGCTAWRYQDERSSILSEIRAASKRR